MNLIAIETSTRLLSVVFWRDGVFLERRADRPNGGSDLILPWIRELLAESGMALSQLDGIAFGAGPGGFTGLRLACSVAQGLAYGADLPVAPVCTLEALALESGRERVYACLDARMSEVYCAAYEMVAGFPREVQAPSVSAPEAVPVPAEDGWSGCGDGFAAYAQALTNALCGRVTVTQPDLLPTAAAVARLAAPRLVRCDGIAAEQATPLYVRNKVALTTAERLARGGVR